MAFRKLRYIPTASVDVPTEYAYTETKKGVFLRKVKKAEKLPPVENFALEKMLEAGVNLEKVSTKIRSAVPSAELFEPIKDEKDNKETLSEE